MQDPVDREKLLAGLQQDVEDTSNQVQQASAGRGNIGPGDETQQYLPNAIRYKGQMIHQKELGDMHNLINKAVDQIVNTRKDLNMADQAKLRYDLNAKMHQYGMDVLNKTMQFGSHLKDMEMDETQQANANNMWRNMMSGITTGIIGYGKGGQGGTPSVAQPGQDMTTGGSLGQGQTQIMPGGNNLISGGY